MPTIIEQTQGLLFITGRSVIERPARTLMSARHSVQQSWIFVHFDLPDFFRAARAVLSAIATACR
jgi:hypothetical protein